MSERTIEGPDFTDVFPSVTMLDLGLALSGTRRGGEIKLREGDNVTLYFSNAEIQVDVTYIGRPRESEEPK